VTWRLVFTAQAQRDARKVASSVSRSRVKELLALLREGPFRTPLRFERLVGDLKGASSRRINIQHRVVYQVLEPERLIKVLRMWTHYQ
jgi:Txe/YoeB family toxin of toxin-antitoxin system